MNQEQVLELAREACPNTKLAVIDNDDLVLLYLDELERFANLVAAAEREACAKVCECERERLHEFGYGLQRLTAYKLAVAIRARGEACAQIGEHFMHITDGIYEENGEIKSGTIPDHIVQTDRVRSAPATRAYYAKAIERANQFTESLRQERLKREAGESGDE
jgi:hypothetical protein